MSDLPEVHGGAYDDPAEADSKADAVFIGEQGTGDTVVVGKEEEEEWVLWEDAAPLPLDQMA